VPQIKDLLNSNEVAIVLSKSETGVDFQIIVGSTPGTPQEEVYVEILRKVSLGLMQKLKLSNWKELYKAGELTEEVAKEVSSG